MEDTAVNEHERDQQAPHTSVPIHEWVDRLELGMRNAHMDESRHLLCVEKTLEITQGLVHGRHWWRHEARLLDSTYTALSDEVLVAPELPGLGIGSPNALEQLLVDFANQPQR